MVINSELTQLSDTMFTTAIAVYTLALAAYTAEYAFGRRGRVADSARVSSAAPMARVLAGAGGPAVAEDERPQPTVRVVTPRPTSAAERVGRAAVFLTVLGAAIHAGSLAVRGLAVDRVPWGNMYEFSVLVGLMAVLAFLAVLARAPQIRFLGGFVMFPVLVVMFLTGTVLYTRASPLVPALQSYWLAIHVSAAATSEGVLMTSAVVTTLFLVRHRYDRRAAAGLTSRFPTSVGARLPEAPVLDRVAFRIVAFAFPLYTFGVIAGAIWAEAAWGRYWGWDPKETWAFIAWVIYAAYLHARATAGWKGQRAAWINVAGFAAMTFNFFVVNMVISGLHSYAGLN